MYLIIIFFTPIVQNDSANIYIHAMHMLCSLPYFYYKYTKKIKVIHKGYNKYVSFLLKMDFYSK